MTDNLREAYTPTAMPNWLRGALMRAAFKLFNRRTALRLVHRWGILVVPELPPSPVNDGDDDEY